MLTASGSPLVAGTQVNTMATQAHRKIRVNRAFYFEGKLRQVGDEFTVPTLLYSELATARKCELAENEPSEDHLRAKAEAQAKAKAAKTAVPA